MKNFGLLVLIVLVFSCNSDDGADDPVNPCPRESFYAVYSGIEDCGSLGTADYTFTIEEDPFSDGVFVKDKFSIIHKGEILDDCTIKLSRSDFAEGRFEGTVIIDGSKATITRIFNEPPANVGTCVFVGQEQ